MILWSRYSRDCRQSQLLGFVLYRSTGQIFSTPQPQNQFEQSSHVDFHTKFSGDVSRYICSYSSGLLYFPNVRISEDKAPLICNPVTGLYVRVPSLERYRKNQASGFLGFDPIDKQFKVVSDAYPFRLFERTYGDDHHNILTLGSEELTWRSNNTTRYDCSLTEGICINGFWVFVLTFEGENPAMVCFDLKSDEFKFINAECFGDQLEYDHPEFSLVNYKGKLGEIYWKRADTGIMELCVWVLEDVEKTEWVNYLYILPENEVLCFCEFSVAGVTATCNIVLVMKFICESFNVFYFNPERNTLQSVEIQGFGSDFETAKNRGQVYAFVDHVEDLSVNNAEQLKSILSLMSSISAHAGKENRSFYLIKKKK